MNASVKPAAGAIPERTFEMSHIRRGRLAKDPVWYVTLEDGRKLRFLRKKRAEAFIRKGGCAAHEPYFCLCGGHGL